MKPVDFPLANVVYAKDGSKYQPLFAYKRPNDPQGLVITKWELSADEIEKLITTGTIYISILTFNDNLQPILPTVDFPSFEEDE